MEKLEYILNEIKNTPNKGYYKIRETKRSVKKFYIDNQNRLNDLSLEKIKKHSFEGEIIGKCLVKEREAFIPKLMQKAVKLEVHKYAPEMNKLWFKKDVVLSSHKETIEQAVRQMALIDYSIEGIRDIIKRN